MARRNTNDLATKYFKEVDSSINKINKSHDFKLKFMIALAEGKVKLSHQSKKITRLYKDDWLNQIEYSMPFLETIVYDPKKFIRQEELLVPVELAKRTTKESIQHLLANARFIDEYDEETKEVRPSKILTINREEDLAIYENRFIKMLILKLKSFLDYRYRFVHERIGGVKQNSILVECDTKFGEAEFKCKMEFDLSTEEDDDEEARKIYNTFIKRIEDARINVYKLFESEFMKQLADAKPIVGEIQRTNILTKEINYKSALDLWTYIGKYQGTGFDIQVEQESIPFDDEYKNEIYNMLMLGYTTIKYNIERSFDDGFDGKIKRIKKFSPAVDKRFKEVEKDYIYEEEIPIPSKLLLLKQIKEEQEKLEAKLKKQKDLEKRAKERLGKLRALARIKWNKEQADLKAKEKKEKREQLKRLKKIEEEKILMHVRAKELRRKEVQADLNKQRKILKEINDDINMYKLSFEKAEKEHINITSKLKEINEKIKKYKALIQAKEKVEQNKKYYYSNLFKYNELKSKLSDQAILKKEFTKQLKELNEELEREKKVEEKIIKTLESI